MSEALKKKLKNDMLFLAIINIALIVLYFLEDTTIGFNEIKSIIWVVILLFGYFQAKEGKKIAGIIGLVVGILMMLTIINLNIIDFLFGGWLFVHSLNYSKQF